MDREGMGTRRRWGLGRIGLRIVLPCALVAAAAAWASASVPHTFNTGDTLQAADLNTNFAALDQRIAALEANSLAGTYPAVRGDGLGLGECGPAPATLPITLAMADGGVVYSIDYGPIVFTSAGAAEMNLTLPAGACGTTLTVCAEPVSFFLISPTAQTISVTTYLDNAGAIYVDGVAQVTNVGAFQSYPIQIPSGPFVLSFLACSNDGPSIGFAIASPFLSNPAYGLTVDYDRTFHRNGK